MMYHISAYNFNIYLDLNAEKYLILKAKPPFAAYL